MPLPAADRRQAIIAAALPLIREKGPRVTTKEIARAAGIAEGTIFRVFPDKGALLAAAIDQALDSGPVEEAIAAMGPPAEISDAAVRQEILALAKVVEAHMAAVTELMVVVRGAVVRSGGKLALPPHPHGKDKVHPLARFAPLVEAVTGRLAPFHQQLSVSPEEAARTLVQLAAIASGPASLVQGAIPAATLVTILTDGIVRH